MRPVPTICVSCLIFLVATFGKISWCVGQADIPDAGRLKFQLDVKRAEVRKPLAELQKNYVKALNRLEKAEQAKGNLKAVIEVRGEREAFKNRVDPAAPARAVPKLNELRRIYENEAAKLKAKALDEETKLLAAYTARLGGLAKELTRMGKIEEALEISKRSETAQEELAALKRGEGVGPGGSGSDGEIIIVGKGGKYEVHSQLEESRDGGRLFLTTRAANAPLTSRENFKTPFRMLARVETDGSLRFYFGPSGIVIFNWDINASTLKIGDPATPLPIQAGFEGQGLLKSGQVYDFEIRVERDKISVLVDGELRGELPGEFSKAEGPIGLGPSKGKAWVESFKGIQEKTKEP